MTPTTDLHLSEEEGNSVTGHYMQELNALERIALGTILKCILIPLNEYTKREHSIALMRRWDDGKWEVLHDPGPGRLEFADDSIRPIRFNSFATALTHVLDVISDSGNADLLAILIEILSNAHPIECAVNDFRNTS